MFAFANFKAFCQAFQWKLIEIKSSQANNSNLRTMNTFSNWRFFCFKLQSFFCSFSIKTDRNQLSITNNTLSEHQPISNFLFSLKHNLKKPDFSHLSLPKVKSIQTIAISSKETFNLSNTLWRFKPFQSIIPLWELQQSSIPLFCDMIRCFSIHIVDWKSSKLGVKSEWVVQIQMHFEFWFQYNFFA